MTRGRTDRGGRAREQQRRPRRRGALLLAGALVLGALLYAIARSERRGLARRVDGRTVADWVRVLSPRRSPDVPGAPERRRAVDALGTLVRLGTPPDSEAARAATGALGEALGDP